MLGTERRRGSIQRSVILLAVSFTLLAAAAIIAGSARTVRLRLERTAVQSAEYALDTAASAIRSNIEEVDSLANWCAANPSMRTWLLAGGTASQTQTVYTTLSGKYNSMRTAPYIQHFLLFSAGGGHMNFGALSSQVSVSLNDAQARASLPGLGGEGGASWQSIVTDPLVLANRASQSLPVARSLSAADGKAAQVYIGVSPSLITDPLRGFALPDGARLYLQMGEELYLAASGALTPAEYPSGLREYAGRGVGTLDPATQLFDVGRGGERMLIVRYPLGAHGMYLAEAIPRGSFDTLTLSLLLQPALMSLVVILLLGVVLALALHRMVARPVLALQRRTERVSQGDFSPDPRPEWNNELGDISRSIDRMALSISAMMDKRLEDEKQKQDLEYRILQNQINPHFIYNTLNSIKWMATIQHASGIAEMTTALSRLLKSVSKDSERLVPLEEELSLLNDYFLIQQYRYGGTIAMRVEGVEDAALLRDFSIPRFTLQPLVENAIFHGIEPRGHAGEICLTIAREPSGDALLTLRDDGVGMTAEQIARVLSAPEPEEAAVKYRHVGVWNVHRRLQYSFGEDYGLRIESVPGQGTTVFIRLPRAKGGAGA